MKKYVLNAYKVIVALFFLIAIIFLSLTISRMDEVVTENITLKYFEKAMNDPDKEKIHEFVADSENDILYGNILDTYEVNHTDTIVKMNFNIDKYELFSNGKHQCYMNYLNAPACDVNYTGRYMNYLIETTIIRQYKDGSIDQEKHKGIVVFVKDGSNGNIFEWKLVRYDAVKEN